MTKTGVAAELPPERKNARESPFGRWLRGSSGARLKHPPTRTPQRSTSWQCRTSPQGTAHASIGKVVPKLKRTILMVPDCVPACVLWRHLAIVFILVRALGRFRDGTVEIEWGPSAPDRAWGPGNVVNVTQPRSTGQRAIPAAIEVSRNAFSNSNTPEPPAAWSPDAAIYRQVRRRAVASFLFFLSSLTRLCSGDEIRPLRHTTRGAQRIAESSDSASAHESACWRRQRPSMLDLDRQAESLECFDEKLLTHRFHTPRPLLRARARRSRRTCEKLEKPRMLRR